MNRKKDAGTGRAGRIKDWPVDDRPREKLLKQGAGGLTDAELLALFIGSGTGGVTAVDLARSLLTEHGGLEHLAALGIAELSRFKGIGAARGARILAAFEIGRRAQVPRAGKAFKISGPGDVASRLMPVFRDARQEEFHVLLLDSGNRVIRDAAISKGTLNASLVHPREVFKTAIDHLAAGVVLAHNHPSGEPAPSAEDRAVTRQIVEAGKTMGIPVLDHVIIAGDRFYSFAQEGLIG
ncbi:DNA repair protein RadC [bacterium]|nr:DNA repair protein RadC [bacterium]